MTALSATTDDVELLTTSAPALQAQATSSATPETRELWVRRVSQLQREQMSPAQIDAARRAKLRRETIAKQARQGSRLMKGQKMAKAAVAGSMMQWSSASAAPAERSSRTPAMRSIFGSVAADGASRAQTLSIHEQSMGALADVRNATAVVDGDEDELDAALDRAQEGLALAGHAWAAGGAAGLDAAEEALGADGLTSLFEQLRREPADDAECASKFALYEAHAETVSTVRMTLTDFYQSCKDEETITGDARRVIDAQMGKIDNADSMGLHDQDRNWFVYSMARKVSQNESAMGKIQEDIQRKLELLAQEASCPCCLEEIDANPHVLGCAHKVCGTCWEMWSETCSQRGKTPFCPLCREAEFREEIGVADL